MRSPREVGPGSRDPQQWGAAAQAAGRVWTVTCLAHRTLDGSGGSLWGSR